MSTAGMETLLGTHKELPIIFLTLEAKTSCVPSSATLVSSGSSNKQPQLTTFCDDRLN
jgi:hypothetical protein